jgi:hypothetical protein
VEESVIYSLWSRCMELAVNAGLIDSVSGHWPPEVRENWEEKKEQIITKLEQEISEIQTFAEALD